MVDFVWIALSGLGQFGFAERVIIGCIGFGAIGVAAGFFIMAYGPDYAMRRLEKDKSIPAISVQQSGQGNIQNNYFGQSGPSPEQGQPATDGPLKMEALSVGLDYVDGIRSDNIVWRKGYSRTEIMISDPLDEAILDLDITIRPERPIISSSAWSPIAKCTIGPPGMPLSPIVIAPGPDGKNVIAAENGQDDQNITITGSHRLYCEKLAARSTIKVVLATVDTDFNVMGDLFKKTRKDPKFIETAIEYHNQSGRKFKYGTRFDFPH